MRTEKLLLTLLLAAIVLLPQGCKTTVVGPQGATQAEYSLGRLQSDVPRNLDTVYEAALKALQELELNVSQKSKDAMSATIIARDSRDKKITVRLMATPESTTKLQIVVGTLGDEAKSRLIYQKIYEKL